MPGLGLGLRFSVHHRFLFLCVTTVQCRAVPTPSLSLPSSGTGDSHFPPERVITYHQTLDRQPYYGQTLASSASVSVALSPTPHSSGGGGDLTALREVDRPISTPTEDRRPHVTADPRASQSPPVVRLAVREARYVDGSGEEW